MMAKMPPTSQTSTTPEMIVPEQRTFCKWKKNGFLFGSMCLKLPVPS